MSPTAHRAHPSAVGGARGEKVTESCVRETTRPNFRCVSPQRCSLCFCCNTTVHENLDLTAFALASMAMPTPGSPPDLLSLVASLDAALLPCLPARELQAADRSTLSDQGDCPALPCLTMPTIWLPSCFLSCFTALLPCHRLSRSFHMCIFFAWMFRVEFAGDGVLVC